MLGNSVARVDDNPVGETGKGRLISCVNYIVPTRFINILQLILYVHSSDEN